MAKHDDDLLKDAIQIPSDEGDELLADAIPIDELTEEAAPASDGIELDDGGDVPAGNRVIRNFERKKSADADSRYKRQPNATGTGGVRAKTFVAKLRLDAIEHLDHQINEWLEQHPNYEVKSVATVVGELTGKIKEPALFMTVFI